MRDRRLVMYPLLSAATVFVGFVVLAIFALLTAPVPAVHGLDHYPSAYLGDSVLLPVAAALLCCGVVALAGRRTDWIWGVAGFLMASGAVMITQLRWLHDDAPTRNWTIPQPHRFNAAGVWHFGYSCFTAGLLLGLTAILVVRLRRAELPSARRMLGGPGAAALWIALLSYVALLVHDSSSGTMSSQTTLMALGISASVLLLLAVLTLGKAVAWMARAVGLGLVAAAGVALLSVDVGSVTTWWTFALGMAVALGVAAAVGSLTLVPTQTRDPETRKSTTVLPPVDVHTVGWAVVGAISAAVALVAAWLYLLRAHEGTQQWALIVAALGQLAVVVVVYLLVAGWRHLRRDADVIVSLVLALWIAGPIGWAAMWINFDQIDAVVGIVVAAVVYWFMFPAVTRPFDLQMAMEEQLRKSAQGDLLPWYARRSATTSLVFLGATFLATALALLLQAVELLSSQSYAEGSGWPSRSFAAVATAGLAVTVVALALRRFLPGSPRSRVIAALLTILWSATLVIFNDAAFESRSRYVAFLLLLTSFLCGWWVGNSVLGNVFLLRLQRVDGAGWVLIAALSISGALSAYWAGSQALSGVGEPWATLPSLVVALAVLAVQGAVTIALGLLGAPPAPTVTQYTPAQNMGQDAFIITLLHTFVVVLPVLFFVHLSVGSGSDQLLSAFVICIPILGLLGAAYRWVIKNASSHVYREIDAKAGEQANEVAAVVDAEAGTWARLKLQWTAARQGPASLAGEPFLRVLAAHVRTQNFIGLIMLLPMIVGILAMAQERASGVTVSRRR